MENLPIPNLRSSWVSAIILAICSFFIYYLALFPKLLIMYDQQFYMTFYPHANAFRPNGDSVSLKEFETLDVMIRAPHYIYSAGPVFVFISATNRSDVTLRNIGVYLTSDNPPPFIIPSLYNDEVFNTGITFDEIPPHSTVTGRISLAAQSNIKLFNVSIVADSAQEGRHPSGETPTLVQWIWKALQHSFIETLLLPPWSNSVIFALALFSSYLVYKKTNKFNGVSQECGLDDGDEQATFTTEWLRCVWINLKWSFLILLVITFLITIFIVDWLFFMIIPIFLICMMFLAWRSRDLYVSGLYPTVGVLFLLSSLYRIFFDYSNIGFAWALFPIKLMHGKPIIYDVGLGLIALISLFLIMFSIVLVPLRLIKKEFGAFSLKERWVSPPSDDPKQPIDGKKYKNQLDGRKIIHDQKNDQEKYVAMYSTEKEGVPQVGFFRRHDQIMAKKISKIIEEAKGKNEELDILTSLDGQLRDGKFGENSELWRWINKRRTVSPEIQMLVENIKIRNPEAGREKREKEREAEKQQKMLKKNKKTIKTPISEQGQSDSQLSVLAHADVADNSKNEGTQSNKPIVEKNIAIDQVNQEKLTSLNIPEQNE